MANHDFSFYAESFACQRHKIYEYILLVSDRYKCNKMNDVRTFACSNKLK